MGLRDRWRAVPPGERVEIALATLCVVLAYVALVAGAEGWRLWLPQLGAVLVCLRLARRHMRH